MGYFSALTEDEQRIRTMNALAAVYRKSMRILSGRPLITAVVNDEDMDAPTWTTQERGKVDCIHFNLAHIGPLKSASDIVRVTGAAHHERCHVMYTPVFPHNARHPIGAVFATQGHAAFAAFNILEDQRIETLDAAQFPSVKPYYRAMAAELILAGTEEQLSVAWPLVHGRRYLGDEVRDAVKSHFKYPQHVTELEQIIDDYRMLDLYAYGDVAKAAKLIDRFREILFSEMDEQPQQQHADHQEGQAQPSQADKQAAAGGVAAARAGKDEDDSDEEGEDETSGSGSNDDGDEEEGDDEGNGKGGEDSDDDGEGQDGQDDTPQAGGDGAGTGSGSNPTADDIKQIASQILQGVMEDAGVKAETRRTQNAITGNEHTDTIGGHKGWVRESRPDVVPPARAMGRKLDRLKGEYDPGWDRFQNAGKLNIQRVMAGQGRLTDDAFDQWNEGNSDATDIETVLIVDVSGSMHRQARALADAAWAIKHAHDKIGATCWVYAFDTNTYLVYDGHARALPNMFPTIRADGGTDPKRALIESARILSKSRRKKKLFVVLTDGDWSDGADATYDSARRQWVAAPGSITNNDIIAEMNGHGVVTAMAYLSGWGGDRNDEWHNTQVHAIINDLAELPPFADAIVRRMIRTNT